MGLYIIAGLSICLKELRQQKQRNGLGIAVPLYVHRRATVGSVRKVPEANVIHVNGNGNSLFTEINLIPLTTTEREIEKFSKTGTKLKPNKKLSYRRDSARRLS